MPVDAHGARAADGAAAGGREVQRGILGLLDEQQGVEHGLARHVRRIKFVALLKTVFAVKAVNDDGGH